MFDFMTDFWKSRTYGGDPYSGYRKSKGYRDVEPGSPEEFEAFDEAEFDKLSAFGSQGLSTLSFGEKLGLMGGGGGQQWAQYGMQSGMNAPQINTLGTLSGLMSMVGKGGQRQYGPEVAPAAPMSPAVLSLMQRGLMG